MKAPVETAQPRPRYRCVRCNQDWTPDLDNIADAPGATLDALCKCQQYIVAEGADPGIHIIEGLIEDDKSWPDSGATADAR